MDKISVCFTILFLFYFCIFLYFNHYPADFLCAHTSDKEGHIFFAESHLPKTVSEMLCLLNGLADCPQTCRDASLGQTLLLKLSFFYIIYRGVKVHSPARICEETFR